MSEVTVRRWTNTGQLTCLRVGTHRDRRFRREDLAAYIENQLIMQNTHKTREKALIEGKKQTHIFLEGVSINYGNHLFSLL